MILIDVNLLLYAYAAETPEHAAAAAWLEETLAGPETVGIPLLAIWAFRASAGDPGRTRPAAFGYSGAPRDRSQGDWTTAFRCGSCGNCDRERRHPCLYRPGFRPLRTPALDQSIGCTWPVKYIPRPPLRPAPVFCSLAPPLNCKVTSATWRFSSTRMSALALARLSNRPW